MQAQEIARILYQLLSFEVGIRSREARPEQWALLNRSIARFQQEHPQQGPLFTPAELASIGFRPRQTNTIQNIIRDMNPGEMYSEVPIEQFRDPIILNNTPPIEQSVDVYAGDFSTRITRPEPLRARSITLEELRASRAAGGLNNAGSVRIERSGSLHSAVNTTLSWAYAVQDREDR